MFGITSISGRVKLTSYIVTGVYSLAFLVYGITLPHPLTKALAFLPTVVALLFAALDNWLWHKGPVLGLVKQPLLDGTWHGTLTSYRRDSKDKKISSEHEAVVTIRQTLTTLSITLMTEQSKSRSATAQIVTKGSGDYVVQYQYQNDPKLQYRGHSPIHVGGSTFEVGGNRPTQIEGEYWTSRDTKGVYTLQRISNERATSFEQGQTMAGQGGN